MRCAVLSVHRIERATALEMPSLDDSASAARSRSTRFKRLRLGAIVLGTLVILAFAGSSAYDA
jgi:hypothetical protein